MTDCNKTDCITCVEEKDCGWCELANECENLFKLVKCNKFDLKLNPRGVEPIKGDPALCPASVAVEADVLSDNRGDLLIAALVGSLGTAAAALAAMAYFLRPPPVEALAGGLSNPDAAMYHDSSIYVGAQTGTNAGYV